MRRSETNINKYNIIHAWIRKNYGNALKCENPDCLGKSKTFDWCLLNGKEYAKDISVFIALCRSCHMKYDMTDQKKSKIREYRTGLKRPDQSKRMLGNKYAKKLLENKLITL